MAVQQIDREAGPHCPFCGEPWTSAMLDLYAGMTDDSACGCCGGHGGMEHDHAERDVELPDTDLCCEHCGRAIYRALSSLRS